MRSVFNFLVKPAKNRYENEIKINDKSLITNTQIFNHKHVSREAIVVSIPLAFETPIKKGDKVIVHHNLFRRWHDVKGIERNSAGYINEDLYSCEIDQVYAYKPSKNNNEKQTWQALPGYCFVQPIKNKDKYKLTSENELVGILVYISEDAKELNLQIGDLVGIGKSSQYEFIIDNTLLYRVRNQDISIIYGDKGDEEAYNPSWTRSGSRVN